MTFLAFKKGTFQGFYTLQKQPGENLAFTIDYKLVVNIT